MEDTPQPEGEAAEQAPYVIEGARSGASKCKSCRKKIAKGGLRLGILVDGFYGPGYMWHHLECAAKRQLEKVEEAYAHEAWKEAKEPPEVPPLESLQALHEKAAEERKQRKEIPYAEVDPSGRAKCKQCGEGIEKGSLRVVLGKEARFGDQVRVGPMNVHPKCVPDALEDEEVATEAEGLDDALRDNSRDLDEGQIASVIDAIAAAR
jgi:hypothetical protein